VAKSSDYYGQKQNSNLQFGIYFIEQAKLPEGEIGPQYANHKHWI
jgi:hypothetical protein